MKTTLIFLLIISLVNLDIAIAQTVSPDSATKITMPQTVSRADRIKNMQDRRHASMPFSTAPYHNAAQKAARGDARYFMLPKEVLIRVKAGLIPKTSDYFKPAGANASNHELLSDSAYVQSYRFYAYNNAQRQLVHPVGTGLLIGGSILAGIALFTILIVSLINGIK
jgi:hypothetical protein